jgi:hypothetical protein
MNSIVADTAATYLGDSHAALLDPGKPIRLIHQAIEDDMVGKTLTDFRTLADTYRRTRDAQAEAETIFRMGVWHDRSRHYNVAIACYERFLRYCEAVKDTNGCSLALNHLGVDYHLLGPEHLETVCTGFRVFFDLHSDRGGCLATRRSRSTHDTPSWAMPPPNSLPSPISGSPTGSSWCLPSSVVSSLGI